jgi:hypothetical protein
MFVFAGTDRRNATLIVEQNGTVPFGAPVRVPISSGAIVVLQAGNSKTTGSAQFSYKVVGTKYNWYEKAFMGKSNKVYILFLVSLCLALAIVLCVGCSCMVICCHFIRKRAQRKAAENQIKPKKKIET